jgi:Tfp pilus assembly protein PilE
MGQQQLLLIILGVIVVGIAVVVGITMFQDNAISANRDAVTNDLVNLGARAQQFYRRPCALGGGQNTFDGSSCTPANPLDMNKMVGSVPAGQNTWTNPNGTYTLETVSDTTAVISGEGTEKVSGSPVKVTCTITPNTIQTVVDN